MNTVKLAHKSLNDKLRPDYLKLALTERKKNFTIIKSWADNQTRR